MQLATSVTLQTDHRIHIKAPQQPSSSKYIKNYVFPA